MLVLDCERVAVIGNEMFDHGSVSGWDKVKGEIIGGKEVKECRPQNVTRITSAYVEITKN